jgi:lipopolysaccharide export system protein LptC
MRLTALLTNILVVSLISLAGILFWQTSSIETAPTSKSIAYDAFGENIISTQYDTAGKTRYEFHAPNLQHYKTNNTTIIEHPTFYMYDKQDQPWKITSELASAANGLKQIQLLNDVNISGEDTDSFKNLLFISQQAHYYPEEGMAVSYEPVTIIQPGVNLRANGMKVFFKENKIQLLSSVKGEYDPTIKHQASY